jgi:putative oxidoreductase
MRGVMGLDPGWGVTIVRIAMALIFIDAGYTKFFVWGMPKVTENMTKYALPMPVAFAWTAAVMELFGGIALLIGLFGRWLGLLYAIEFAVVFFWVELRTGGFEAGWLAMMLLAGGVLLFLAGPGCAAADSLWIEKPPAPPRYVKRSRARLDSEGARRISCQ